VSESAVGELDGRRVLVTGAATGIGAAAVEAFTSHGATVAATYHHTPAPQHLQAAARWRQCDVRSRTQVQHTIDAVHAWTRTVAKAWANCGVTVNAVAPAVETPGAQRVTRIPRTRRHGPARPTTPAAIPRLSR